MFEGLGTTQNLSKLDLKTRFHQIRVAPCDLEKTSFISKCDRFGLLVMPLALQYTPKTLASLINSNYFDMIDKCFVIYLNDLLVYWCLVTLTKHIWHTQDRPNPVSREIKSILGTTNMTQCQLRPSFWPSNRLI